MTSIFQLRSDLIVDLRRLGMTYKWIAGELGISPVRARQIFLKAERAKQIRDRHNAVVAAVRNGIAPRGSVIDMGGARGRWLTWTPEKQEREFSRLLNRTVGDLFNAGPLI